MIPSAVPTQLSGLTQVEEMLIAKALPIMHIYIKPGGQRGYSGHTINLPQNVSELAQSLPRYPKDLSFSNSLIIHADLTQPEHHILVRWMGLETQ